MTSTDLDITIDRSGPDGFVYVQDEDEQEALIPRSWLPGPAQEGDVFRLTLREDKALRDQRRAEVTKLIGTLSDGAGDEDVEEL